MGRREWHRSMAKGKREALPAGCMSGMLHFFDFHNILFSSSGGGGGGGRRVPQGSSPQRKGNQVTSNVGVEAPRNSLELDETAAATAATMYTASALADEEYFGVPIGIQVKAVPSLTRKHISRDDLLALAEEEKRTASQCGTPRTPNVVARLMGLDILPDGASTPTAGFRSQGHSPKLCTNKTMVGVDGPRKEPPPPQRRQPLGKRDTNVLVPNPRLEVGSRSLPETPRASSERSREDPRLSLQIVNKENINSCDVSRSLPPSPVACAASHVSSRSRRKDGSESKSQHYAREIVKQVKESIGHGRDQSPDSGSNVNLLIKSRRTRPTDKRVVVVNAEKSPPPPRFFEPPKPPRPQPKPKENADPNKCKKAGVERFNERIVRQPSPAETAAQPSKNRGLQPSTSSSSAELWYVRSILERGGVMSTTPRWPIDPFVFHQLELDPPLAVQCNPGPLRHRCNRKLMFHLVVEILSDLLGGSHVTGNGDILLDGVWSRIRGLPSADCQVMEDIDGLVAGDIAGARGLAGHPLVEAEAEGIAAEIEGDVLDCAIGEAAAAMALCSRRCPCPFHTSR